jgi:hypothetical protein
MAGGAFSRPDLWEPETAELMVLLAAGASLLAVGLDAGNAGLEVWGGAHFAAAIGTLVRARWGFWLEELLGFLLAAAVLVVVVVEVAWTLGGVLVGPTAFEAALDGLTDWAFIALVVAGSVASGVMIWTARREFSLAGPAAGRRPPARPVG